jgi:hypothetical protein
MQALGSRVSWGSASVEVCSSDVEPSEVDFSALDLAVGLLLVTLLPPQPESSTATAAMTATNQRWDMRSLLYLAAACDFGEK